MEKHTHNNPVYDILICVSLFLLALLLRVMYLQDSEVYFPIRADAAQYFFSAYNLHAFDIYSITPPSPEGIPPVSRTDLSPGYPLFLLLFFKDPIHVQEIITSILKSQAILGAFVVVITFFIARLSFNRRWAVFTGLITACSPHLIMISGFLLTESLFTFVLTLSALVLALSWKHANWKLSLLAGFLISFSAKIRAINLIMLPFLALVYLIHPKKGFQIGRTVWLKHIIPAITGFLIISSAHQIFINTTVNTGKVDQLPEKFVSTKATWKNFLYGTYPGFYDDSGQFARLNDPNLKYMLKNRKHAFNVLKERFLRQPLTYVKWYLGGKLLFMWRWDSAYTRDIYIYPMTRKGFDTNIILAIIYNIMHILHWPLFLLTIIAPLLLFVQWKQEKLDTDSRLLLIPLLIFLYFASILTLLQPLPRYALPAKPFSYILSMTSLSYILESLKNFIHPNNRKLQQ